jgi:hypothetical protein
VNANAPQIPIPDDPPQPDSTAQAESLAIASGQLRRDESKQNHFHIGGLVLFWFAIILFLCTTVALVWQYITPDRMHFLTDAERNQLQTLLVTALGSSVVTNYGKNLVNK